jgi:hypothetical protein
MRRRAGRKHIERVYIDFPNDDSQDFSTIGEFTNDPDPWAIVRFGPYSGEYIADLPEDAELPRSKGDAAFFLPYAGGEKPGTDAYQEYGLQDWERAESYERDQWGFMGVVAKAEITTSSGYTQTISSGGLWGVESDVDSVYKQQISQEELSQLGSELEDLGFNRAEIDAAMADVEYGR